MTPFVEHPGGWLFAASFTDVTAQRSETLRPSPNAYVIEIIVDDATMVTIANDTRYAVLWQEAIVNEPTG